MGEDANQEIPTYAKAARMRGRPSFMGEFQRGPRPFLRFIKSGGVHGGFGFPPKAELARPTGKAFPNRFPPGNARRRFREPAPFPSHLKSAQRISNARNEKLRSRFSLPGR
jgi:hypothetical protein